MILIMYFHKEMKIMHQIVYICLMMQAVFGGHTIGKGLQNITHAENEEIIRSCVRFTSPNTAKNTFLSPINPKSSLNAYPPKIDCKFVLEAPVGFIIKLDFRNYFNIESSSGCEFDYLEIRDGKHGFSKEIGRFCGSSFPQTIYSSDQYLWLHFHSDDNIEYEGFQCVYEFQPRPTSSSGDLSCTYNKTGFEGNVTQEDIGNEIIDLAVFHKVNIDCLWRIEVEKNWQILLVFNKFNLVKKNDCDSNFLDVFGEVTDIPSRLKNFCGVIGENVLSKSNVLHIRFFAEPNAIKSTEFSIVFTAYRQKDKGTECASGEFDCDDDTCINGDLLCNKRTNCKFFKDETDCPTDSKKKKGNLTIIIIVFCIILAAMITAFMFKCLRKLIQDQKIIMEHIRQSRESKIDEVGTICSKHSWDNVPNTISRFGSESLQDNSHLSSNNVKIIGTTRFETRNEASCKTSDMAVKKRQSNNFDDCSTTSSSKSTAFGMNVSSNPRLNMALNDNAFNSEIQCKIQGPNVDTTNNLYSKPIKLEKSRICVDIRNSAPDVIIMTSN